jgi:penicillin amidase
MLRAASVRELDEAMRTWVEPGNNFVMADVHGDIGYLTRGQVPVRPRSNGWLPVPGSTGEHEWQGTVPFEEMPRMRNPEDGCIVTANNRIVGDEYPHFLSNDWRPAWRASRIRQVLEGRSGLCPEDMPAIHAETFSAVSRAYVDLAREITPGDDAIASARQILLDWDGRMEAGSRGAAIYAVWREMLNALIVDQPGLRGLADAAASHELLPGQALPVAARVRAPFYALMVERNPDVLPTGESWTSLGARALSEAVTWLGSDPSRWTWGRIHRTQPRHVLAGLFPDEADSLNPPSVGVGGDGDTPRAAAFRELTDDGFAISGSAVARYCFDLSDWDRSGWVVPLGGSGDPRSPHYADQVENWARVELYPMPYSAAAVEQAATERTELISARAVR